MSEFISALVSGRANLAIVSLPATLILSALPHWYSIYLTESNKLHGGWPNENPRAFVARMNARAANGKGVSALEETILRGQSAQQNGFEWWAVWAVAVVLGHLSKLPTAEMNRYALIHMAGRCIFNYLYIIGSTRRISYMRTAVFQFAAYPAMAIFFRSALILV